MKQRIITGLCAGAILILLLVTSNEIAIKIAVGLISIFSLYEFYGATGLNEKSKLGLVGIFLSVLLIVNCCMNLPYLNLMLYISLLAYSMFMLFSDGKISLSDISVSLFGMIYVVFSMLHIVFTRSLEFGYYYLYIIIFGACVADIFAYFDGCSIGKHKLCEKISPKKTIEGAVGGLLGSVIVMLLLGFVISILSEEITSVNYVVLGILGVICSVFAQLGDLTASVIKRQYNIKDYGHILPGHGGFMDRIDSIIFVAPIVYYYVSMIKIFN